MVNRKEYGKYSTRGGGLTPPPGGGDPSFDQSVENECHKTVSWEAQNIKTYGVATISKLHKIVGLFCRI